MKVEALDASPEQVLSDLLFACCGARRWVDVMLEHRPFGDGDGLLAAADAADRALDRNDWLEAFSHHPRIGDVDSLRARFGARSGNWSAGEQAGVHRAEDAVLEALATANQHYEARFGHLFIVCASGKTADEMLALLNARVGNSPARELEIAAGEQAKITRLRLAKLLADLEAGA